MDEYSFIFILFFIFVYFFILIGQDGKKTTQKRFNMSRT